VSRKTSDHIADALHLHLSPDLQEWFDGGQHKLLGSQMFNDRLDPEEVLLGKHIWGGQMPPDTLPVVGNGAGDYLCAKFTAGGELAEIVAWHHEGSHWDHYGSSLSQALTFDIWNSTVLEGCNKDRTPEFPGISQVAALRVACKLALRSRLHEACSIRGGGRLAESVGVPWMLFRTWLFDPSQMAADKLERLAAILGINAEELVKQDWEKAFECATSVIRLRADLAWPYTVAGWAYEKAGNIKQAIDWYSTGFCKLGATLSFTSAWTTTPSPDPCRFSIRRLLDLAPPDISPGLQEYIAAEAQGPLSVRSFWMAHADQETKQGQYSEAYDNLYFAGWDSHCSNDVPALLQALAIAAKNSGSPALEALALLHLRSV
jgi:hypothetical protein